MPKFSFETNSAPLTVEMITEAMQAIWDQDQEVTREQTKRIQSLHAEFDLAQLPTWVGLLITQREPVVVSAELAQRVAVEMEKVRRPAP